MDFITKLLLFKGYSNIVVIIDRLGKEVIIDGLEDLEAEIVVN